ncbi:hypothetical protein [Glutamicibacter sp. NPDC090743]|uniref:hypothetical protein n=1 Tax=Glutamicibacter sp. NPDC090743 TaxID=3364001 RepID=UPI003830ED83
MENDEESDISMEFGRVLRMSLGAAMQVKEASDRRAANQNPAAQTHQAQQQLAAVLKKDVASPDFTKMSSQQIADRMIVASELSANHRDASKAFMSGSDRLRNELGINIEDIYKNHPQSAEERHHALRNAIDDYHGSARLNQEAAFERGQDGPEATPQAEVKKEQAQEREDAAEGHLAKVEQAEGETQVDARDRDAAESREAVNAPSLGKPETQHALGANVHPDDLGPGSKSAAAVLARARAGQGFPSKPGEAVRFGKSTRPAAQRGNSQARKRGQSAEVTR